MLDKVFPGSTLDLPDATLVGHGVVCNMTLNIVGIDVELNHLHEYVAQILATPQSPSLRQLHERLLCARQLELAKMLLFFQDTLTKKDTIIEQYTVEEFAALMIHILEEQSSMSDSSSLSSSNSSIDFQQWTVVCNETVVNTALKRAFGEPSLILFPPCLCKL